MFTSTIRFTTPSALDLLRTDLDKYQDVHNGASPDRIEVDEWTLNKLQACVPYVVVPNDRSPRVNAIWGIPLVVVKS